MLKKPIICLFILFLFASAAMAEPSQAHTVSPVNPKAQQTTKDVMNWLAHLPNRTENRVLSGAFGGYSHDTFSMAEAERIRNASGQSPAIYGCDYARGWLETSNIEDSIDVSCNSDLISYWKGGGIPQISLHLANPAYQSGHFKTPITNDQYKKLLDSTTTEGKRLNAMLSKIADGLQALENQGVPVLFRPLHEMNGEWFWWGLTSYNQKDDERIFLYKQLYIKIYHYMTDERGLDHLLWVYSPDANRDFKTDFYPGASYVDIVGLDAYFQDPYSISGYDQLTALNKPFAFTEVGPQTATGSFDYSLFMSAIKQKYPKTTYYLAWNDEWSPAVNKGASAFYNDRWTLNKGEVWNGDRLTPIVE
ncbi:glycoside hydrolase family 26 protein [Bacillus mojavensis]|uniref:glycoside hydrolase family 26 protein n=2 Tax=Bacillus mojavensis TaxID=72360 RepID=UPI002DB56943|nr:glycoside hydrolase family 26 protein [Bacillus mojavensis]MEC1621604.1 glycoside hydrolase family 26 protein [Bacillus mojavensis]MEC1661238.1 glycoside hydrolase family 26 protein [Bacillus mojavensis]MEC1685337.1 glycoside hydrolase family 26 protein [Bacillus mojavensis]MEC1707735.1 glycoside hydrolase family 26 protein [Bacillus mojavensis]